MSHEKNSYDPATDPTRMTNQPALQTSRGAIWFLLGGLLGAIAIAELAFLVRGSAGPIAIVGIVVEVLIYAGMVTIAFAVPASPRRLRLLAVGMVALAAVGIVALLFIIGVLIR
jgi:hypothetical protein